jgi:hypothetical protein
MKTEISSTVMKDLIRKYLSEKFKKDVKVGYVQYRPGSQREPGSDYVVNFELVENETP